jgi:CRISPR-associated protein Csm3
VTSAANPRNLERVPKGAKFEFSLVYDVEDDDSLREDLDNLRLAIRLLQDDCLGGHGSRGYGHVRLVFADIEARKIGYYKGEEGQTRRIKDIAEIDTLSDLFKNGKTPQSE